MNRRHLIAASAILPTLLRSAGPQPAHDKNALAILKRMQTSLGGADQLAAIRELDWTVRAKTWDASGAPAPDGVRRIRWIRPNIFRKDQRSGNLFVIEFFDGTGGWEVVPDAGFLKLQGHELAIVRKEAGSFMLKLWLADRDSQYQVSSAGNGAFRITSEDVGIDILLDPATGLPHRTSAVRPVMSGTVTGGYQQIRQRGEILEWRTVDGIRWPQRTINIHDDVKRAEITTTAIQINTGIDRNSLSGRTPAV